ncbi:MAG TPA: hypothetical protein VGD81_13970 [Opitutaceae bacterium]
MKSLLSLALLVFTLGGTALRAGDQAAPAAPADYPLTTCVVSGEKLGSMGKPYVHVHQEEGKPDRVVQFCCRGCIKDFKKDPAQYLAKLDAAEAAAKAKKN